MNSGSSRIRRLLPDRRGVSTVEYALLLVAILLVVAMGFRLLGKNESQAVNNGVKTLQGSSEPSAGNSDPGKNNVSFSDTSDGTDPYDDGPDRPPDPPASNPGSEHKSGGGGFWHGVGNFFKGAIGGDFAGDTGWQGTLGQVVVGFIPIVGDVAAVRDVVHGGIDVVEGKPGGWEEVGAAGISLIPEVGGALKAGIKGAREAHAVEEGVAGVERGTAKGGEKGAENGAAKGGEKAAANEAKAFSKADATRLIDESEGRQFGNNTGHARDHVPKDGQDPATLAESRRKPNGNPYDTNTVFRSGRQGEQALRDIMNSRADDLAKLQPGQTVEGSYKLQYTMEGMESKMGGPASRVQITHITYSITKLPDGSLHLIHFAPRT